MGTNEAEAYTVTVSNAKGSVTSRSTTPRRPLQRPSPEPFGAGGRGRNQLFDGRCHDFWQWIETDPSARRPGPSLGLPPFNLGGILAAPQLNLHTTINGKDTILATNSAWGGSSTLSQVFAQVGAFALPSNSLDDALLTALTAGSYTDIISGANNTSGIALAEVYDADAGTLIAKLINLSARAFCPGTGSNALVAGFVITGTTSETVLIRAVGPTLGNLRSQRRLVPAPIDGL